MSFKKKMKKCYIFIIIIIFLYSPIINAQKYKKPQNLPRYDHQKIHFGFTLGVNALNFNIQKNSNIISNDSLLTLYAQNQKGFNLGIVSNFRLGKYTDLRFVPALVFGERILNYNFKKNGKINEKNKRIESTLIDFPLYLKYKSERYNNFRTYVITGIKYSLDIAAQDEIDDEGEEIVKLRKNDLMGEIGFGIDFYLEYFKLSPQIKLSRGILNLISKDQTIYSQSINKLSTNGWIFSLTFE
tara:strand:- start:10341 stop:11066 length:726 start_codon:yes stop_codon:yes gene_type:complete